MRAEGRREGMTEMIQEYRKVVGGGVSFEGSGGRWMSRGGGTTLRGSQEE